MILEEDAEGSGFRWKDVDKAVLPPSCRRWKELVSMWLRGEERPFSGFFR